MMMLPTDDFSEIENPENGTQKENAISSSQHISNGTSNNQVSEFIVENDIGEEALYISEVETRKHQLQNLIVEDMQPLYYFNVKPKHLDSMSLDESNGFNNFLQGT